MFTFTKTNFTKTCLLSLFTSCIISGVLAQPVITESVIIGDLNKVNKIVLYETNMGISSQLSTIIGAIGANQTWDFTELNYVDSTVIYEEFLPVLPDDPLLNDPNFAGSNIIWKNTLPPVTGGPSDTTFQYRYGTLANNQWIENGSVSIVDIDMNGIADTLIQWFSPPSLMLEFPITSSSFWTDSTSIMQEFQGMVFTSAIIVDTNTVEGWGTVITPEGSGQALRLHNKSINRVPNTPIVEVSNDIDFITADKGLSATIVIEDGRAFYRKRMLVDGPTSTHEFLLAKPDFMLGQNFPNPFTQSTNVVFSLEKAAHIEIQVIDMQGRLVEKLIDGKYQSGSHQIEWRPNIFQSGTLILEMKAGNQIQRRMLSLQR